DCKNLIRYIQSHQNKGYTFLSFQTGCSHNNYYIHTDYKGCYTDNKNKDCIRNQGLATMARGMQDSQFLFLYYNLLHYFCSNMNPGRRHLNEIHIHLAAELEKNIHHPAFVPSDTQCYSCLRQRWSPQKVNILFSWR